MITGDLKSQIDKIWNDFWTGGISNPLTVIEQFTYLIFLKQLDDKQTLIEKRANMLGVTTDKSIYSPEQKELRWSTFQWFYRQPLSVLRVIWLLPAGLSPQ